MSTLANVRVLLGDLFEVCATFPIYPVVDGHCSCADGPDCKATGKHPAVTGWQLGPEYQKRERTGYTTSYGINTGHRSGNLFALDCDIKPGIDGLARLSEMGELPRTRVHATPSGGKHYLFFAPDTFVVPTIGTDPRTRFAEGVDVRGEGGLIVAPGCPHKNGGVYTVECDADVAMAPDWVMDRLRECKELRNAGRNPAASESDGRTVTPHEDGWLKDLCIEAALEYCATCPPSIDGQGGSVSALRMARKLTRSWLLDAETSFEIAWGLFNPRCSPPWSEQDLMRKITEARDNPRDIPEEWPQAFADRVVHKLWAKGRGVVLKTEEDAEEEAASGYTFTPGIDTSSMSHEPKAALPVDVANTLARHTDWDGVLRWNTFNNRLVAVRPPLRMDAEKGKVSDADVAHIRMWLSCNGKLALKEDVMDAMNAAAKQNPFHPIIDYLETCPNLNPDILDDLAAQVFGNADPLSQEFLKKTLVAAVRRIYRPGTRVDTVLTLMGRQGARKTTFVQVLFGEEYVRSQMPDLSSKDASIALQDFWAVELGELHRTLKGDHGTVKEFLSRTYDDFRPPHGRNDIRMPRHNIFIGTVNEDTFLSDATGNRRFWPIAVQRVDIEFVRRNRDDIWGAAVALEKAGYQHWFEDESVVEPAHAPFVVQDPWHNMVRAYVQGREFVTNEEVFKNGICGGDGVNRVDMTRYTKGAQMSIADTLKRLGCERRKNRGWHVAPKLASATKMVDETGATIRL